MYVHPAFKTDDDKAWKYVEERGFGAVVAIDAGKPVASHVPLMTMGGLDSGRLQFHVARVNPLHEVIARALDISPGDPVLHWRRLPTSRPTGT